MWLVGAIAASGLLYLWAVERKVMPLVYALKPGTMALIILLALGRTTGGAAYGWWVVAGLLFSVVGDVALMLPRERFVTGLAAFLLAHLCYIAALWGVRLIPADLVTGAALAGSGLLVFRAMAPTVRTQHLLAPVLLYFAVISVMVWRGASATLQGAPGLVAAGALLFYASDATLAWHRFVRPVKGRDLLVMSTYFAAQLCFALSVGR